MQGLLVCKQCSRVYCGGKYIRRNKTIKDSVCLYYRCTGIEAARFGGTKMCNSKQVSANAIELIVWEEVKKLLKHPERMFNEYQRRLIETKQSPLEHTYASIEKQKIKLERSISLLIDSYTQQYIIKDEFEPRIKTMRQNLKVIQEQQKKLIEQKNLTKDMELIINNLENFVCGINSKLGSLDWHGRRDIIRRVIKRIEIGEEEINIVYKITKLSDNKPDVNLQHCCNRMLIFLPNRVQNLGKSLEPLCVDALNNHFTK